MHLCPQVVGISAAQRHRSLCPTSVASVAWLEPLPNRHTQMQRLGLHPPPSTGPVEMHAVVYQVNTSLLFVFTFRVA